jgi:hypothetical protein
VGAHQQSFSFDRLLRDYLPTDICVGLRVRLMREVSEEKKEFWAMSLSFNVVHDSLFISMSYCYYRVIVVIFETD